MSTKPVVVVLESEVEDPLVITEEISKGIYFLCSMSGRCDVKEELVLQGAFWQKRRIVEKLEALLKETKDFLEQNRLNWERNPDPRLISSRLSFRSNYEGQIETLESLINKLK